MNNNCLYHRHRRKKGELYQYCVRYDSKGLTSNEKCYMCPFKEYKKTKPIKKVSKNKIKVSHETYIKVFERDGGVCQFCGTNQDIHAHHILYRSQRKDLIDEPINLILLCEEHHRLVHSNKKKYQPMLLEMMKNKTTL